MFELVRLDETNAFQYDRLTYPTFRPRLRILKHDRSLIAVGVHLHQMPVGLALAEYLPDEGAGEILSLFVAPEYRGTGIRESIIKGNGISSETARLFKTPSSLHSKFHYASPGKYSASASLEPSSTQDVDLYRHTRGDSKGCLAQARYDRRPTLHYVSLG
ncbi:GNAT family N-acetyltransferase [Microcoleus vaginatus]|uniref:GNAT family N-acetyltransferase n=1 Tax=Microcoleus vaginatus TaxID=119532 RepID=UPI00403F4058